jgi:Protein of unknown function (DUF2924)
MRRVVIDPAVPDREALDKEIARLRGLDVGDLRARWHTVFRRAAPPHLPRHLLFRVLAYRLQADQLGDLDADTRRVLDRIGSGSSEGIDQLVAALNRSRTELRPGTLLTREWDGHLQRVMVLADGFATPAGARNGFAEPPSKDDCLAASASLACAMLLPSGPVNTRRSVCRFDPGGLHVQLRPAPGTGLQSPETGSQNQRYRDLSRRQRPHVPHLNPRKCPQIARYSSETGKRRFASDCVVGPGVVPRHGDFNNLDCQTGLTGITGAKGIFRCCQISRP